MIVTKNSGNNDIFVIPNNTKITFYSDTMHVSTPFYTIYIEDINKIRKIRFHEDSSVAIKPIKNNQKNINSNTIYPSPFNYFKAQNVTVRFALEQKGNVDISIYNNRGQKVKRLVNTIFKPGTYYINWNGKDENGSYLSTGQYFVNFKINDKNECKKILLMK
jgi:hypothetical protein